jgi:hypothetical protein
MQAFSAIAVQRGGAASEVGLVALLEWVGPIGQEPHFTLWERHLDFAGGKGLDHRAVNLGLRGQIVIHPHPWLDRLNYF